MNIGWPELLVVGIVALIVIGPKDLPALFRSMGQFTGKIKKMSRDFSRAMNDAAKDSGMSDLKDIGAGLKKAANPASMGLDAIKDATKDIGADLNPDSMGPETSKLTEQRREQARLIREATAKKAEERKARQLQEKLEAEAAQASIDAFEAEDPGMVTAPEDQGLPAPKPEPEDLPTEAAETVAEDDKK